jgi:hypothetical protein
MQTDAQTEIIDRRFARTIRRADQAATELDGLQLQILGGPGTTPVFLIEEFGRQVVLAVTLMLKGINCLAAQGALDAAEEYLDKHGDTMSDSDKKALTDSANRLFDTVSKNCNPI